MEHQNLYSEFETSVLCKGEEVFKGGKTGCKREEKSIIAAIREQK